MGLIKQNTTYKIYYFLFMALAIALPIHGRLVPPIILFIGLNWLLEFNFREKYYRIVSSPSSKYFLGFSVLYLLYVLGTFYSSQLLTQEGAIFNLEVKLSLLLFPIFFTTIDFSLIHKNFKNKILKAFVIGCLISMILLFNNAVFNYFKVEGVDSFYYVNLAFIHHPSYLALYLNFAIAILLYWLTGHFNENSFKRNMAIFLILIFQLFIVLLSSKAGILSVLITYVLMLVYALIQKCKVLFYILPLVLVICFLSTLSFFPYSYSRFYSAESAIEEEPDPNSGESSVARIMVWNVALELIKENPVFGVGTGDVEPELMKLYKEKNIKLAMDETLNAHNQYLQTFIALGIAGILVLLASLFIPGFWALREKQLLYLLFLAMFAFNMLVESMLERQAGVVFYAFFNSFLFYFAYLERKSSDPKLP